MSTPSIEATVQVAVAMTLTKLSERGYSDHFVIASDGAVCCPVCGVCALPAPARVDDVSLIDHDREEVALVLAVRCDVCHAHGAAVAWAGATGGVGDGALLAAFSAAPAPG